MAETARVYCSTAGSGRWRSSSHRHIAQLFHGGGVAENSCAVSGDGIWLRGAQLMRLFAAERARDRGARE